MLERQIARLRRCTRLDDIVLATTVNATDEPLLTLARRLGLHWFRGSEHDVLERFAGAAREAAADVVVRVTGDCPLIDPDVTDKVIEALLASPADYASNVLERTYPRGLDVEALYRDVVERMVRMAVTPSSREHVTTFLRHEYPNLFVLASVKAERDDSDQRWTVDTSDDLGLIRALYERLDLGAADVPYLAIADYIRTHPDLACMNAHVRQKAV